VHSLRSFLAEAIFAFRNRKKKSTVGSRRDWPYYSRESPPSSPAFSVLLFSFFFFFYVFVSFLAVLCRDACTSLRPFLFSTHTHIDVLYVFLPHTHNVKRSKVRVSANCLLILCCLLCTPLGILNQGRERGKREEALNRSRKTVAMCALLYLSSTRIYPSSNKKRERRSS